MSSMIQRLIPAVLLAVMTAHSVRAADHPGAQAPVLQVLVSAPKVFEPSRERDVVDQFSWETWRMLRQMGFKAEIVTPRDGKVDPAHPALLITLDQWRLDLSGMPECEFSARLAVSGHEHDLGTFRKSDLHAISRGAARGEDWLQRIADDALRVMARKLIEGQLLPGIAPAPKGAPAS